MDAERFARVRSAFEAALELPEDERRAAIEAALEAEPELRTLALAMLEADGKQRSFLTPPTDVAVGEVALGGARALRPGDELAGFTLLRRIGSGGMAEVWEAEQAQPKRHVALKLPHAALATERSLRRFEREAELLARLAHPNVASILAAGVLPASEDRPALPWFAMELIEGARPLLDFALKLPLAERLELFIGIADAVHHGHLRGVIHRDLKPDNILVDAAGRARVIDFGIARLVEDTRIVHTAGSELLGTLAYMSPEQVEGQRDRIDARTDVYSLGLVLFELATGASPWRSSATSWAALTREVLEEDPPAPSALAHGIPIELDWIVARATAKRPEARYNSAHELADEVRHLLAHEPILAAPESRTYLLAKFARRHRAWFVGGSVALVLLVLGSVGTSVGLVRSLAAERRAEERTARADSLNEFLDQMLRRTNPLDAELGLASETRVGDMLEEAAQDVGTAFTGQPELEAKTRLLIGVSLAGQGRHGPAEEQLRRARELYRGLGPAFVAEDLHAERLLATSLAHLERWDEAETRLRSAYERGRAGFPHDDLLIGQLETDLAWLLQELGRAEESVPHARAAVERLDRAGPDHAALAATILARAQRDLGDPTATEAAYLDALTRIERSFGASSAYAAIASSNLGAYYYATGRTEAALARFEAAADIQRHLLGSNNPLLATTLYNLGSALSDLNRLTESEDAFRECLELLERTLGKHHHDTTEARTALADALWLSERYEDAASLFSQAFDWYTARGEASSRKAVICRLRLLEMRTLFGPEAGRAEARRAFAEELTRLREQQPADDKLVQLAERAAARMAKQ